MLRQFFWKLFFGLTIMDYVVVVGLFIIAFNLLINVLFKYKILTALVQINAVKRVFIEVSCIATI